MKKILSVLFALFIAMVALSAPAVADGSDGATPYTVDKNGVTLPDGKTFEADGHVNIKYTVGGGSEKSKGIHFDPNNNQPGGKWIGKKNIPWNAFGLTGKFCVTWVQVHGYNQHFGEGGQPPLCLGGDPDPKPDPDSKKVTLCHATSSQSNPYNEITVSVKAFYNSGHIDHKDDIWESFTYTTVGGEEVTVPAQGNTNLLNFPNCQPPPVDIKVVPSIEVVDLCGTKNDKVRLVPGTGYDGGVTKNGLEYTVTAETDNGYVFNVSQMDDWTVTNGKSKAVKKVTLTDEDCDLPETGGEAQFNTLAGLGALAVLAGAGTGVFLLRRRNN